jgi:hypothetical protein
LFETQACFEQTTTSRAKAAMIGIDRCFPHADGLDPSKKDEDKAYLHTGEHHHSTDKLHQWRVTEAARECVA